MVSSLPWLHGCNSGATRSIFPEQQVNLQQNPLHWEKTAITWFSVMTDLSHIRTESFSHCVKGFYWRHRSSAHLALSVTTINLASLPADEAGT